MWDGRSNVTDGKCNNVNKIMMFTLLSGLLGFLAERNPPLWETYKVNPGMRKNAWENCPKLDIELLHITAYIPY